MTAIDDERGIVSLSEHKGEAPGMPVKAEVCDWHEYGGR